MLLSFNVTFMEVWLMRCRANLLPQRFAVGPCAKATDFHLMVDLSESTEGVRDHRYCVTSMRSTTLLIGDDCLPSRKSMELYPMAFTQLKQAGNRIRVDLAKVKFFTETSDGTRLTFDNGDELFVDESYQTVSNRTKGEAAGE